MLCLLYERANSHTLSAYSVNLLTFSSMELFSWYSIGLIPCADGGTSVDEWQPGTVLFDNLIQQTKLAMRSSEICGVLWHQGESDSKTEEAALSHACKLTRVICGIRRELDLPDLPFIIGELAYKHERWPYTEVVNKGMHALCGEVPHTGVASCEGYEIGSDTLHFTAEFYREFGVRYYRVYEKVK